MAATFTLSIYFKREQFNGAVLAHGRCKPDGAVFMTNKDDESASIIFLMAASEPKSHIN